MFGKAESLRVLLDLGEWDDILRSAPELLRGGVDRGVSQLEVVALFTQTQVGLFRGGIGQAAAIEGRLIGLAHKIGDLQVLIPALVLAAYRPR
jgi:hypothetical protein